MKQANTSYSGFIMILTLFVIALGTLITTIMFNQSGSYIPYMRAVVNRQHAMLTALGGIALVQELLSRPVEIEPTEEPPQPTQQAQQTQQQRSRKPTDEQKMHHLLRMIFPVLNQWQHVELTEKDDGFDGMISIYVTSEDGKINLNKLFDFEKKQFVGEVTTEQAAEQPKPQAQAPKITLTSKPKDWKQLLTVLFERIEKETKTQNLFKSLETFLKKREFPLNDITELLHIPAFAVFKNTIYPYPADEEITKNKTARTYTLTDLFTLYSDSPTIEPWLLSDSMIGVLGLQNVITSAQDEKKQSDVMNEIIKKAKVRSPNWQQSWDTVLKPLYGVEAKALPKQIFDLFNNNFKPRYFSAIIVATIGESTQRLFVILERIEKSQDTKTVYDVKIRKFSWV